MGIDSGFERAVPCQVVEYPSSSMQAPRQHVMKKADTNNDKRAAPCFSGLPVGSCCAFGEVTTDTENGLFALLGIKQTGLELDTSLPLALLLSDSFSEPLGVKLPAFLLGFFQAELPHAPTPVIASLGLPEICPVICVRSYQSLSSVPSARWD